MTTINKSKIGGKLVNDLIRGFGLQLGRSAGKQLESGVKKKTLDTNSKFRKSIDRFTLSGDFPKDVKKIISLINQFDEEYSTTEAYFQKDWYLAEDVKFIESKLSFLKSMIISEEEEIVLERITGLWVTYRDKNS
jgi:hypothetical protein